MSRGPQALSFRKQNMVGKGPCSHDMSGLVWIPAKARHCLTQLVIITPYGNHSEWSYYPIWGYLPSTRNRNRDFKPLGRYPESGFPTTRKIPGIGISKSRRFRKCGSFWTSEFLNGSYRCSKLTDCQIFGSVTKNKRRYEKKTRPQ